MKCKLFGCKNVCKSGQQSSVKYIYQIGPQGERGDVGPTGPQGEQGLVGPTGPQGEIGLRGVPGEKGERGEQGIQGEKGEQGERGERGEQGVQGEKGEKGDSGSAITPAYANFLDLSQQAIQFTTMQRGFLAFYTIQNDKNINLVNSTDIVVADAGVYKIDISFSINNFYNSSNLMLFVNDAPVSNLLSSFSNGSFSMSRIIRLSANDVVKIGATITRLVLNTGLSLTIFKLDD